MRLKPDKKGLFYTALAVLIVAVAAQLYFIEKERWISSSVSTPPSAKIPTPVEISKAEVLPPALPKEVDKLSGILVDNFDRGRTSGIFTERLNSLGSYQGTWAKRPSYSVITKSFDHRRGDSGQGLAIEWRNDGGWCGWYTLLMDDKYKGIDVSKYNALTFWVKGAEGGEKFDIGLADFRMQELEIDAMYAGSVKNFVPKGITKEWQKVRVPLSRVASNLDLKSMGSLVFWFRYGGSGKIHVEDIWFEDDPEVLAQEEYNAPKADPPAGMERALWVWKIDPIQSKQARADLFEMCERSHIDTIYQYFGDFSEADDPDYAMALEEFLVQCHARGIHVEALTGNPVWALKENHDACLAWIEGFLDFNSRRPPEARMDGVSLDVEPYLTAEWNTDRERIKKDYIELLDKCRALIDRYGQKFSLGGATPLLYELEPPPFHREVFERLDIIALMSYYDTSKAIIEKARAHVMLADELGKKILLGVETQDLVRMNQGKRRNTFIEEGWEEMEQVLNAVHDEFKNLSGYGGVALHCFYSYKLMQRGRNVPKKERDSASELYTLHSKERTGPVVIDGDLSDWDLSNPFQVDKKTHVVFGAGAWLDPTDLSFAAHGQWDPEHIYLAFEMTDNKVVQEKTGSDIWEGDHMELWLDVQLEADYYEAVNSNDDLQIGISPGNFSDIAPELFIWVPDVAVDLMQTAEVGAKKTEHGYTLEVKIPAKLLYAAIPKKAGVDPSDSKTALRKQEEAATFKREFSKGMKLGIMMDGSDSDDPLLAQKCLISSSTNRIWGDPTVFGALSLE